jgi:MATE family multidrug resistance protein
MTFRIHAVFEILLTSSYCCLDRETNCFIVGSFGVVPLCVHTIAYNLVPLLFMIPLGISIGLTVRMGNIIAYDVPRAKLLASWCMGFTVIVATIVSLLLYHFQVEVAMLFSSDPEIIQGCRDIWPKLCYYIFVIYIFGTNSAILRALGMQWELAAVIFICLWLCTLPAIVFFAIKRGGGIDSVWNVLPIFYTIMQVILVRLYTNADWHKISREIGDRARQSVRAEATAGLEASEGTHLLAGNN